MIWVSLVLWRSKKCPRMVPDRGQKGVQKGCQSRVPYGSPPKKEHLVSYIIYKASGISHFLKSMHFGLERKVHKRTPMVIFWLPERSPFGTKVLENAALADMP